ncbi:uncharacterized protein LOC143034966 [Oratosquilla oratoria]|uniref:uncharacterized protein LOC143034966 n=1 Tax=Oratosquilla oratoria TaxID=337810 RepID=UPI003F76D664
MADLPPIQFVPTTKGGVSLVCASVKFRFNMRRSNGGRYWKCTHPYCKATAITDKENRLVKVGDHNHSPKLPSVTAEDIVPGIEQRAVELTHIPIPNIYQEKKTNAIY